MMEQDVKVAEGVEVKAEESLAAESVEADISIQKEFGPISLEFQGVAKMKIDNTKIVALAAAKVPGGFAHAAIVALAAAMGVELPAAPSA